MKLLVQGLKNLQSAFRCCHCSGEELEKSSQEADRKEQVPPPSSSPAVPSRAIRAPSNKAEMCFAESQPPPHKPGREEQTEQVGAKRQ